MRVELSEAVRLSVSSNTTADIPQPLPSAACVNVLQRSQVRASLSHPYLTDCRRRRLQSPCRPHAKRGTQASTVLNPRIGARAPQFRSPAPGTPRGACARCLCPATSGPLTEKRSKAAIAPGLAHARQRLRRHTLYACLSLLARTPCGRACGSLA